MCTAFGRSEALVTSDHAPVRLPLTLTLTLTLALTLILALTLTLTLRPRAGLRELRGT